MYILPITSNNKVGDDLFEIDTDPQPKTVEAENTVEIKKEATEDL